MKIFGSTMAWLLIGIFLLSGGAKLAGLPFEIAAFERWGYPLWFMLVVGAFEVLLALALAVRRWRGVAAVIAATFMLGALATHLFHAEWGMLGLAVFIQMLAASVAWLNFGSGFDTPPLAQSPS